MKPKLYQFVEGIMTIAEFRARFTPCLSPTTIQARLAQGINDAPGMLRYDGAAVSKAAAAGNAKRRAGLVF